MKHWYLFGSIILVITALFLRFNLLASRAPFDWDQNRDYQVISGIASGKATLIGPVAKGEGGFFLGPLYYYLATPTFLFSQGNPLALPATSVILDVLAIAAILALLPRVWSHSGAFALGSLWTFSFFAIELSKISWNVALIPLYSVLLLYFALVRKSPLTTFVFGLLLGLSWHIHAALIPLIPLFALILLMLGKLSWKDTLPVAFGYILALSPLLVFDLRHNFLNLHLMLNFAKASGGSGAELSSLLLSLFSRFGKNIYSSLFVSSDLHLMWGIAFTLLSVLSLFRGSVLGKLSGIIILLNLALVLLLREVGFAEYYLGISYLPALILLFDFFLHFQVQKVTLALPIVATIFALVICSRTFTTSPTSYSLGQKQNIVSAIAAKSNSVDLRYDLPFGRNTAFDLLLPRAGVTLDEHSKTKVIISEKMGERLFIDGEITETLGYFGGMYVGIRVLQ